MSLLDLARLAFSVAVFAIMITIGLRTRPGDAWHLMRHWPKGVRAFAALFVVVPATMILTALLTSLPPAEEVALIALSVSPMLPTLPAELAKLGADHGYCISLDVVGGLMALIATPVVFWIVSQIAGVQISIAPGVLLASLAQGVYLPLLLGAVFAFAFPLLAARITGPIASAASAVLWLAALALLWSARDLIRAELDWQILLAIVILVAMGLVAGHALGGPEAGDRAALAMTAASRHIGFAFAVGMAIAPQSRPTLIGVALIYFLARGLLVRPYARSIRARRAAAAKGVGPAPAQGG